MKASVPITAFALFQIGQSQVADLPQIAFQIPDFEGTVSMAIFANSSETQIGCLRAVMKNGATFSHPRIVGAVLGFFTAVAIAASFVTAAYGVSLLHMRTHYAHSLSVLVLLETLQSVFFSGALSVRWPSVLPAWWSNFAWSVGLLPLPAMMQSIDAFAQSSGNARHLHGASSTAIGNRSGLVQQIYGGSLPIEGLVQRRSYNASNPYDYDWSGDPVALGMPVPGDWRGFAGTLSALALPAANALVLALVWLLVVLGAVVLLVGTLKMSLECLARLRLIQKDRLAFFRSHWTGYLCFSLLRTLFIVFFAVMVLTMSGLAQPGHTGPVALAAVFFAVFVVGMGGIAACALHHRLRAGRFSLEPDRILLRPAKMMGCVPCLALVRLSQLREAEFPQKPAGSLPFVRWHFADDDAGWARAHDDESYIKRFGWLSSRYRVSRWWYFGFWLSYQFVRAGFIGLAAGWPTRQVFGLFIVDFLSLSVVAAIDPYEGERNSTLGVWLLGVAKLVTTGLSVAFLPDFAISRIPATVIGIFIIIIQALLVLALLVLVVLGALSSWMSLSRNQEYFASAALEGMRIRYYEHLARKALDHRAPSRKRPLAKNRCSSEAEDKAVDGARARTFSVATVRRMSKIEDEDDGPKMHVTSPGLTASTATPVSPTISLHPRPRNGRAQSLASRRSISSLPRAARVHRVSWSSRDFSAWQADSERSGSAVAMRLTTGGHTPAATSAAVPVPAAAAVMLPPLDTGPDNFAMFMSHFDVTTTRNG